MSVAWMCLLCDVELGKQRVCKAHHLADVSHELAMLIRARKKVKSDKENNECTDVDQRFPADKTRKIARMSKIRQIEGIPDVAPVVVSQLINLSCSTFWQLLKEFLFE